MKDENEILRKRCEKLQMCADALDELVVLAIKGIHMCGQVYLAEELSRSLENIRQNMGKTA